MNTTTMSTQPPENTPGPIDQLALRYLRRALDSSHPTDEPYVLNEMETHVIHKIKWQTLVMAGLFGVLGVVLLYLPQYFWPFFFERTPLTFLNYVLEAPLITALYGILLVYLEIYALLYINLRAVRYIMAVCQFPRQHDAQYERHLQAVADAAQEERNESILRYSIDPYLGLPRWGLTFYLVVNRLKAALSNTLLKFLVKRLFGRFLVSQVADFVSMPVYACWNVWASHRVIHEAKIRVMAPLTVREFVENLHDEWKHNDEFRRLIPEALQYTAILKRQYNYAHLLLTESLMNRFAIQAIKPTGDFLTLLEKTSPELRRPLERLIVFGVLIDGDLSWLEKQRLRKLKTHGWLTYSIDDIEAIGTEYNKGRGLWV
jgi:hypothetical protein